MIQAHSRDFAAIGGAVENGVNRSINWAVYFCDFINYQKPFLMEETSTASDVNISYKREFIEAIRSIWQDGFHEPEVHRELKLRGWKIGLDPDSVAFQMRNDIELRSILKERFIWGRHFAARRQREFPKWKALAFALFSPLLPFILMFRKIQTILLKRRNTGIFVKVSPLIFLFLVFWASGELVGYITGKS